MARVGRFVVAPKDGILVSYDNDSRERSAELGAVGLLEYLAVAVGVGNALAFCVTDTRFYNRLMFLRNLMWHVVRGYKVYVPLGLRINLLRARPRRACLPIPPPPSTPSVVLDPPLVIGALNKKRRTA